MAAEELEKPIVLVIVACIMSGFASLFLKKGKDTFDTSKSKK